MSDRVIEPFTAAELAVGRVCATKRVYGMVGHLGREVIADLAEAGFVVIPDQPDHYVTFDQGGWFITHSVACRVAGTLGTCAYNAAIRKVAEAFDPDDDADQLGTWKITDIDSEGLPSLEAVPPNVEPADNAPAHIEPSDNG